MKILKKVLVLLFLVVLVFPSTVLAQSGGRMYFERSSYSVNAGEIFETPIYIDTDEVLVAGAGAVVEYDKNFLEVVSVSEGNIFDDYPLSSGNVEKGVVNISGIASSKGSFYNGAGVLGAVKWRAKKAGLTSLSFQFSLGETTDSNIAVDFGNGDLLSTIQNANITISNPAPVLGQNVEKNIAQTTESKANDSTSFLLALFLISFSLTFILGYLLIKRIRKK